MTAAETRPREPLAPGHELAGWRLRVAAHLAQYRLVEADALRKVAGASVRESDFRRFLRWLAERGLVRPRPCPRCPRCGSCGELVVIDDAALHRMVRWSQRQGLDTAYRTQHVADAP